MNSLPHHIVHPRVPTRRQQRLRELQLGQMVLLDERPGEAAGRLRLVRRPAAPAASWRLEAVAEVPKVPAGLAGLAPQAPMVIGSSVEALGFAQALGTSKARYEPEHATSRAWRLTISDYLLHVLCRFRTRIRTKSQVVTRILGRTSVARPERGTCRAVSTLLRLTKGPAEGVAQAPLHHWAV